MKYLLPFVLWLLLLPLSAFSQQIVVTNASDHVTKITGTVYGDYGVFVLHGIAGAQIKFIGVDNTPVSWEIFDESGTTNAKPIAGAIQMGNTSILPITQANRGYIIRTQTGNVYICWIIDYLDHYPSFTTIAVEKFDCDLIKVTLSPQPQPLFYYNTTGIIQYIPRSILFAYNTQQYDATATSYITKPYQESVNIKTMVSTSFLLKAPLCNTTLEVKGDSFLEEWGLPLITITSSLYETTAIAAESVVKQEIRTEAGNETGKQPEEGKYGGSAPVEIHFKAITSEAVTYAGWQIARDEKFENADPTYNEPERTYILQDAGNYWVRLSYSNKDNSCAFTTPPVEITVGESKLECPNYFNPYAASGQNQWKVVYQSILDFKCSIFNRWGVELFRFTNPSQGWDGKANGKIVSSGVYFYVIEAKGADGKKYKKSGDINILSGSR